MTKRHDAYAIDTADPLSRLITERFNLAWSDVLLIAFLLYGPAEKLLLPVIGGYAHLTGSMRTWLPDIEALLTGFVEFPFFLAYYAWGGRGIGHIFKVLGSTAVFGDDARYEQFWMRARRSFRNPLWTVVATAVAIAAMIVWQYDVWGTDATVPPWFELRWDPANAKQYAPFVYTPHSNQAARVISIALIGVMGYTVAQILVREILTHVWLSRLWRELHDTFVVHPYHPDDAGGVGAIGRHALHLSMLILALLLFVIMGSILPGLRGGIGSASQAPILDSRLIVAWVLYFVFVSSTVRPLLLLPHEYMCAARDKRVSAVSAQLDTLLEQQQQAVSSTHSELESIGGRIEALKKVRAQIVADSPTWPFSTDLRVKLGLSSVPVILLPGVKYILTKGFASLANMVSGVVF